MLIVVARALSAVLTCLAMDQTLSALHDEIDTDYDQRLAKVEDDRKREHEALDRLWPRLAQRGLPGITIEIPRRKSESEGFPQPQTNGHSASTFFPLLREIENLFVQQPERQITQQYVFDILTNSHPILKKRDARHLRGQIAGGLGKLRKQGKIVLVRKGTGADPHVYRKGKND
jgi:hypothetical protein